MPELASHQMSFCPNCSIETPIGSESCRACGAEFGANSAWKPTSRPWQGRVAGRVESGPPLNLFFRLCGTVWMLICIGIACIFVAAFGVFSAPIGLPSSPLRVPAFAAGAYIPFAIYAALQLWTRPSYTTLYLVAAVLPLFFPFVLPMLIFLS